MPVSRSHAPRWTFAILLAGACIVCPFAAAGEGAQIQRLRLEAEVHEKHGDWEKACEAYERILRLDPDQTGIKARYVNAVRRHWQGRRHRDDSYRAEVLSIEYGQAIHLYGVVRDLLLDQSLERKNLTPARLFHKGLEEFDHALADRHFRDQHIPLDSHYKVGAFRTLLQQTWGGHRPATRREALKQICEIALAAENYLRLNSSVVVMEFTCGACYALDEYTVYLTPAQLRELCTSLRGPMAGVGLALVPAEENKVLVQQVDLGSPAARAGLNPGDQIVSIDKRAAASVPPEMLGALLEGPPGSSVELEVISPGLGLRTCTLRREAVLGPSVTFELVDSIGHIRVTSFQESTLKEFDDAIARLSESGMKALILDLRGNGGGLFETAVEVARRFLPSGIIATKHQLDDRANIVVTLCEAKNPAALTLPLVVLIDNDTASSAEVVAGALKDNRRATLIGEPTYGKGCTQYVLKLPDFKGGLPAGGMRLTVAKVYSPKGLPYTGRGVLPDILVSRDGMPNDSMMPNSQLTAARLEAQRLLMMGPR
jgi:carboxyl-terminal processing protease